MNDFMNQLTSTEVSENLTTLHLVEVLGAAVLIGLVISIVYLLTHKKEGYSQSFCVSIIILAPIVALVILLVGNNVARAFSLAGAFALIRFRSAPGDPKDIAFIFMSVVLGLACGMGYIFYGAIACVFFCLVIVILHLFNFAGTKKENYTLKITVPETLNYVGAFDETLNKYCSNFKMTTVKSVDFGALFDLTFSVTMNDPKEMRMMLDDLRALNGNLKVMLSVDAPAVRSFHFQ